MKTVPDPEACSDAPDHAGPSADAAPVIPLRSTPTPSSPLVIAVASGKGGVGKTNISANLAVALGSRGVRVLAVDADLGLANLDIVMGLAPTHTSADLVRGDVEIEDVLLAGPPNVWLLPGSSGTYDLANLSDVPRRDLMSAIDTLDERFDAVVIDTGAGLGHNAVSFTSAAQDIVLVVTPEPTSVADAYGTLKALSSRYAVRRVKVLASLVTSDNEGPQVFERLTTLCERSLDVHLEYLGAVPFDPCVGRAVMRGEPVSVAYPSSDVATAFDDVAERLLASSERDDREGALRIFWRRLLRQGGARR